MFLIDLGNGISGPRLVSLLREVMDPLRGRALLEEVCCWEQALEMYNLPQLAKFTCSVSFVVEDVNSTPSFLLQPLVAVPPPPQCTVPSSGSINQHKLFSPEVPLGHGVFIT